MLILIREGDSLRRKRPNPTKKSDLAYTCPHCGYRIHPSEILLTDGEHILCPACVKESVYAPTKGR